MKGRARVTLMASVVLATGLVLPGTAAAQESTCGGKPVTIYAQPGITTYGTQGDDVIRGTDGPDRIHGRQGNDLICSAWGNDEVHAGQGVDSVWAGEGDDVVYVNDYGEVDHADGGKGTDKAFVNSVDTYERMEEVVVS
ncbi:hypothetical protein WEH80_32580 [Actinomycetes bacterium KLBMP 9759]